MDAASAATFSEVSAEHGLIKTLALNASELPHITFYRSC